MRTALVSGATAAFTVLVMLALLSLGWVGDVAAVGMPAVLAASAVCALVVLVRRPNLWVVPCTVLAASSVIVFAPRVPERTAAPVVSIKVSAVNLKYNGHQIDAEIRDVQNTHPAVLVVSELTRSTDGPLSALYPYRIVSDELAAGKPAQGVFSMVPITRLEPPAGVIGEVLRVAVHGSEPFTLFAAHVTRPTLAPGAGSLATFAEHREAVAALDRAVDAEPGPAVIAGDLNLSDRTSGYRRLSDGRVDVQRTTWASSTFIGSVRTSLLLLRIDYIFVPDDWCVRGAAAFHLSGSDHRGLTASIGPCA